MLLINVLLRLTIPTINIKKTEFKKEHLLTMICAEFLFLTNVEFLIIAASFIERIKMFSYLLMNKNRLNRLLNVCNISVLLTLF